jgi:hypothetical protein
VGAVPMMLMQRFIEQVQGEVEVSCSGILPNMLWAYKVVARVDGSQHAHGDRCRQLQDGGDDFGGQEFATHGTCGSSLVTATTYSRLTVQHVSSLWTPSSRFLFVNDLVARSRKNTWAACFGDRPANGVLGEQGGGGTCGCCSGATGDRIIGRKRTKGGKGLELRLMICSMKKRKHNALKILIC